jgi:hypothetical protein
VALAFRAFEEQFIETAAAFRIYTSYFAVDYAFSTFS